MDCRTEIATCLFVMQLVGLLAYRLNQWQETQNSAYANQRELKACNRRELKADESNTEPIIHVGLRTSSGAEIHFSAACPATFLTSVLQWMFRLVF